MIIQLNWKLSHTRPGLKASNVTLPLTPAANDESQTQCLLPREETFLSENLGTEHQSDASGRGSKWRSSGLCRRQSVRLSVARGLTLRWATGGLGLPLVGFNDH